MWPYNRSAYNIGVGVSFTTYIIAHDMRRVLIDTQSALFDTLRQAYCAVQTLRQIHGDEHYNADTERLIRRVDSSIADTLRSVHILIPALFDTYRRIVETDDPIYDTLRWIIEEYEYFADTEREIPGWQGLYLLDTMRQIWETQHSLHDTLRENYMSLRYKRSKIIGGKRYWPIITSREDNK
jgi:hypothetical protein